MYSERASPNLLTMASIAIVIFVVIAFAIIAMNTRDVLWFWPNFKEFPDRILVQCYGQDVMIKPGDVQYQAVNEAVNQSLSGSKRWDPLTMSDVTFAEYEKSPTMMVLMLSYEPPVSIHSFYTFYKSLDMIIIPLDGRHASSNSVFGRINDRTTSGSLHVKSTRLLTQVLAEQDLCQINK